MPGRPPTLEDVAARAGVSRALVSIVMRDVPGASEATRDRVRAVAGELGYRPDRHARMLAGTRTGLLGVTLALNNPFHADVVEGVYAAAEHAGFEVVLSAVTGGRSAQAAVDTLVSYRCEAVLALEVPPRGPGRAEFAALAEQQPVIVVGQRASAPDADAVRVDDVAGLGLAVSHLVELGHRRIAYVDGGRAPNAAARRDGFRRAMRRAGLTDVARIVAAGPREEDGGAAAHVLARTMPDAVITYNDRSAVGLLDVFARTGVAVPGDVSVVGYDDSRVGRLSYLRLTTVGQHPEQLAEAAVARVLDRLAGRPVEERDIRITPHLVVRATTAPRPVP